MTQNRCQMDMNQAIAILSTFKHWTVKCLNSAGHLRRHECTIWGNGKRVSASATTPIDAVNRAIAKLAQPQTKHGFKIVS